MSKITTLSTGQITATDLIKIELVQTEETPAVVIVTWPEKSSVLHPRRFGNAASTIAATFAAATVRLAQIRRDHRLS
jgi:hypothetical protein